MTLTDNGGPCLQCIDGMTPSTSALLGLCYRTCLACQPGCPCCNNEGVFSTTSDLGEFLTRSNNAGYMPVLCHTCYGVVDLIRHPEEHP